MVIVVVSPHLAGVRSPLSAAREGRGVDLAEGMAALAGNALEWGGGDKCSKRYQDG